MASKLFGLSADKIIRETKLEPLAKDRRKALQDQAKKAAEAEKQRILKISGWEGINGYL